MVIFDFLSIFSKASKPETDNLPKTFFLLDDSEVEDSRKLRNFTQDELDSPKTELMLRISQKSSDNCTLLAK